MSSALILQTAASVVELFFAVRVIMAFSEEKRFNGKAISYLAGVVILLAGAVCRAGTADGTGIWAYVFHFVIPLLCMLLTVMILSRDGIKRRMATFSLIAFPPLAIELLFRLYLYFLTGTAFYGKALPGTYAVNYGTVFLGVCDITFYSILIMWHNRRQVRNFVIPIVLLVLLPMMQLIYLTLVFRKDLSSDMDYAMLAGIGALMFNTAINILFIRFIASNDKIFEREKEEELKANLEHLDKRYFEAMEHELDDTRKVKQDILGNIEKIKANIESGEITENDKLISEIGTDVNRMTSSRFCEEPTVDMVLTLKKRKAESLSVPITVKAVVPSDVNISKLDLSSVVSNLADNAIESASQVTSEGIEPYVKINVALKGELLVVRTENSTSSDTTVNDIESLHTTKDNTYGIHGYGLKILQNIANRYGGELTVDIRDHVSVFTMMLNCGRGTV